MAVSRVFDGFDAPAIDERQIECPNSNGDLPPITSSRLPLIAESEIVFDDGRNQLGRHENVSLRLALRLAVQAMQLVIGQRLLQHAPLAAVLQGASVYQLDMN